MREFCYNLVRIFLFCHFFISLAMGINGLMLSPESKLGYEALFAPAIVAFLGTLPSFVMYSKKELSVGQTIVRKIIQLALIEIIVLSVLHFYGPLNDTVSAVVVGVTIFAVFVVVHFANWIRGWNDAKALNRKLEEIKIREREN